MSKTVIQMAMTHKHQTKKNKRVMAKIKIYSGKRWANAYIIAITDQLFQNFEGMGKPELKAIISTAEQFTASNCGWQEYWAKALMIRIAKDCISEIELRKKYKPKYGKV